MITRNQLPHSKRTKQLVLSPKANANIGKNSFKQRLIVAEKMKVRNGKKNVIKA